MTNGILKSINTKDLLYLKMVQASTTNHEAYDTLKTICNTYTDVLSKPLRLNKSNTN